MNTKDWNLRFPVSPWGYFRTDYLQLLRCPRCQWNLLPMGYPGALSRRDNETELCSNCGTIEGLEDWATAKRDEPVN